MSAFLFYSYSHNDEVHKNELRKHLSILQKQGYVEGWSDRQITAGDEWEEEINLNLQKANIILLLVSSDFLDSNYCYDTETVFALEQHEKGNAIVIPIIVRPCLWPESHLSKLQVLPKDGTPITKWENQDEAWLDVSKGILRVIKSIEAKKTQPNKNNLVIATESSIDEINKSNTSESSNSLKQILVNFLKTYYSFYFSPLEFKSGEANKLALSY